MSSGPSFELPKGYGDIAASEQFVYTTTFGDKGLRCLTHDGTEVASYQASDECIYFPTLAPGGLLFCVESSEQDEIIVLDAQRRCSCSLATGLVSRCQT